MSKIADDTRGGFNTFLLDQREENGTATVSLYDFNITVACLYERIPIEDAEKLNTDSYTPACQTMLSMRENKGQPDLRFQGPITELDRLLNAPATSLFKSQIHTLRIGRFMKCCIHFSA